MLGLGLNCRLYARLVVHTWNMKPNRPRHSPRRQYVLRPEPPTLIIPLKRSCRPVGNDKPEDCTRTVTSSASRLRVI